MKNKTNINKNSVFDILGVEQGEWFIITNEIDYCLPTVQTCIVGEGADLMVFYRYIYVLFGEEEGLSYHRRPKSVINEMISDVKKGKSKIIKTSGISVREMRLLEEDYDRKAAEKIKGNEQNERYVPLL